jgi:hypothetical protein
MQQTVDTAAAGNRLAGFSCRKRVWMAPRPVQALTHRRQIEDALMAELNRREEEWLRASEENRDRARQQFLDALLLLLDMLAQGGTLGEWPSPLPGP